MALSKNQVRQLGRRLRDGDITAEDFELLGQFLTAAREALTQVEFAFDSELGLRPVTRVKTTTTLVEKLRRSRNSNLDNVQDVAGARLVLGDRLEEQDEVGQRVVAIFSDQVAPPRVIDRRREPSFGYRALHVVVYPSGFPVEVQIRTQGQDRWAQLMERVGDEWGREIRYGGPPLPSGSAHVDEVRRQVLVSMNDLSVGLAQDETFAREVRQIAAPALRDRSTTVSSRWKLRELIEQMAEVDAQLRVHRERVFADVTRQLDELA